MVKELNTHPSWRRVFGSTNNRSKDEELIVRFLALYADGDKYVSPMNGFLNDFSAKMNKVPSEQLVALKETFIKSIEVVDTNIPKAFRLVRALNAAVFDSVMVGVAKRIAEGIPLHDQETRTAYNNLLANSSYRQACEQSTAREENVKTRRNLAIEAFAAR